MNLCVISHMIQKISNLHRRDKPGAAGVEKVPLEGEGAAVLIVRDFGF